MRRSWIARALVLWSLPFLCLSLQGQQSAPKGGPFLRRSFALLTGGMRIRDVTLTGTATLYSGSNSESGPVTLTAVGATQSKFDAILPSGRRTELRVFSVSNAVPSETSIGPSGVFSVFGAPDATVVPVWFFPASALAPGLSLTGDYGAAYVGRETQGGAPVDHLQILGLKTDPAAWPLKTHDIYLSTSHLLLAIAFNLPDSSGVLDIPVEIQFSDYRPTGTQQLPFHIQVFRQGSPLWDIQISSSSINTGATLVSTAPTPN